jgi:hypothetical protein
MSKPLNRGWFARFDKLVKRLFGESLHLLLELGFSGLTNQQPIPSRNELKQGIGVGQQQIHEQFSLASIARIVRLGPE